uniref:Cytochrome c oxidase subunit NDUFA4 n=1 Tax=Buteo japonicus TaxID=224669 RepID=A0A8C0AMX0_9AVES
RCWRSPVSHALLTKDCVSFCGNLFGWVTLHGLTATVHLQIFWDKKNNPEPWNKLSPSDQYKFYSVNVDYSRLKKDRPDF